MTREETIANWRDITYLRDGTARQRQAFQTLSDLKILSTLSHYDPILVSTVCLAIGTPTSDLDIICEVHDHERFIDEATRRFGSYPRVSARKSPSAIPATVVQFFTEDFEIELFGQALPVEKQAAYAHLLQAHRVIQLGGEGWRSAIQELKLKGLKTEPAIARLLALPGDPYQAVLDLQRISDDDLRAKVRLIDPILL